MSLVPFDDLPADARLWCFGASRPLSESEQVRLGDSMRSFLSEWTAHRQDLRAAFEWTRDGFLLVAVDESRAGASGCSIDEMNRHLRRLGAELDVDFLDGAPVWFRDADGDVTTTSRAAFSALASQGDVGPATRVFDLTVDRVGDYRNGRMERPAADAWHRVLLTGD